MLKAEIVSEALEYKRSQSAALAFGLPARLFESASPATATSTRDTENDEPANWLRSHKRAHWVYKELELNLRIKPRKRLVREKPEA
jgi:hypothetical protein